MSTSNITVYFATNRKKTKGKQYFGAGMRNKQAPLHVGHVDVTVKASVRNNHGKSAPGQGTR
ncbi:MAG: hypothetical protein OXP11_15160 [Gammaproteobacteria bacterium]|nr:hypothetical protein [Gammaproteobacteria bacterium]